MAAISIQDVSKKYKLRKASSYVALRDVIVDSMQNIFKSSEKDSEFWALKDINLEVNEGERLGIIGHNGAGKSTLLKIISKITPPTTGRVIMEGRVASLLEVGTGFHPELTGRENIYLNGSILGLKKKQIDKRLDEIIDFSGVEKFIDIPLKRYSSGMQLRLTFSVAAHLEADILLIDEVLAVGDIEFQKKCIGKMKEVSSSGNQTILFVSHNLNYISSLCNKCILLEKGNLIKVDTVSTVVAEYLSNILNRSASLSWNNSSRPGNEIVRLNSVRMIDSNGIEKQSFRVNEEIGIEMDYDVLQSGALLWLGHNLFNQEGINIFDTHSVSSPFYTNAHEKGKYKATAWIPGNFMNTGTFSVSSAIFNHLEKRTHFHVRDILGFQVHDIFDDTTARGLSPGEFPGVIRPFLKWNINKS